MLREPFANVAGEGTVDDFGKRLLADVAERDLSAMVEATSDYATVMKNRNMRIQCTTRAWNDFATLASLVFALRARLFGLVIQISVLICATLASFVFRLSSLV